MTLCERCQRQSVTVQSVDLSALPIAIGGREQAARHARDHGEMHHGWRHSTASRFARPSAVQSFALSVTGTCVNSSQDGSKSAETSAAAGALESDAR